MDGKFLTLLTQVCQQLPCCVSIHVMAVSIQVMAVSIHVMAVSIQVMAVSIHVMAVFCVVPSLER